MRTVRVALTGTLACVALLFGVTGVGKASAATINGVCSSGVIPPGTYTSLTVTSGYCFIPSGTVTVLGNLSVRNQGILDASSQTASVTVMGSAYVYPNSVLVFGCAIDFGCPVPPNDSIRGDVFGSSALGILLHGARIGGNVTMNFGGGGVNCNPNPLFLGSPAYSDIEDSTIGGYVNVVGLTSCWFGLFRNQIAGSVYVAGNTFFDPDATEVATNTIRGYLRCYSNSPSAQIGDSGGIKNTVAAGKFGECVNL